MTRKQIDQSREIRLWVGQIVIPAFTLVATAMSIPEVRQKAMDKYHQVKQKITKK